MSWFNRFTTGRIPADAKGRYFYKLDEKVKSRVILILRIKLCQVFQIYSLVARRVLGGDFVDGEMTVNRSSSPLGRPSSKIP